MNRLEGKVCIITGGNSGVGAATAKMFAKEGAKVVITARRVDKLDDVAAQIRAEGGEVLAVRCDVSNEEDVVAMVKAAVDAFGTTSVLSRMWRRFMPSMQRARSSAPGRLQRS